jgi:hypothetical protein
MSKNQSPSEAAAQLALLTGTPAARTLASAAFAVPETPRAAFTFVKRTLHDVGRDADIAAVLAAHQAKIGPEILTEALNRGSFGPLALRVLARSSRVTVRRAVAAHLNVPPDAVRALMASKDEKTLIALGQNPSVPLSLLAELPALALTAGTTLRSMCRKRADLAEAVITVKLLSGMMLGRRSENPAAYLFSMLREFSPDAGSVLFDDLLVCTLNNVRSWERPTQFGSSHGHTLERWTAATSESRTRLVCAAVRLAMSFPEPDTNMCRVATTWASDPRPVVPAGARPSTVAQWAVSDPSIDPIPWVQVRQIGSLGFDLDNVLAAHPPAPAVLLAGLCLRQQRLATDVLLSEQERREQRAQVTELTLRAVFPDDVPADNPELVRTGSVIGLESGDADFMRRLVVHPQIARRFVAAAREGKAATFMTDPRLVEVVLRGLEDLEVGPQQTYSAGSDAGALITAVCHPHADPVMMCRAARSLFATTRVDAPVLERIIEAFDMSDAQVTMLGSLLTTDWFASFADLAELAGRLTTDQSG